MGGRIFIPADDQLSIHGAHTGKLRVHKELQLKKLKGYKMWGCKLDSSCIRLLGSIRRLWISWATNDHQPLNEDYTPQSLVLQYGHHFMWSYGKILPWRYEQNDPPKCWHPPTRLHTVMNEHIIVWTFNAINTWSLMLIWFTVSCHPDHCNNQLYLLM